MGIYCPVVLHIIPSKPMKNQEAEKVSVQE